MNKLNCIDGTYIRICDWAWENRAYLQIKFGLIFELYLTITFKALKLYN